MSASGFVGRVWRWVRWPLVLLAIFVIGMTLWRMSVLDEKERTVEAVAAIHANRLEWSDINGDLPPAPDPELNEATLVGVDSVYNFEPPKNMVLIREYIDGYFVSHYIPVTSTN